MKRSPLRRRKPLARGGRLRPVSKRRAAQRDERAALVERVLRRDGTCMARVVGAPGACFGPLVGHEIVKRSQMRDAHLVESNVIAVCSFHNTWIEDNPPEAKRLGLWRSRWEADE